MYFPYLRGKLNEQLAVLETNPNIYSSQKVIPIFEPCTIASGSISRYKKMCDKNIPFILIVNPKVQSSPSYSDVVNVIQNNLATHNNFHIGFIVNTDTTQTQIQNFMAIFPNLSKVFIHQGEYSNPNFFLTLNTSILYHVFKDGRVGRAYINTIGDPAKNISLKDGFNRLSKNADYNGPEFFCDLHVNYTTLGFCGFSDYQTVSDFFAENGGAAHAVAIHLTYQNNNSIEVAHFVSDIRQGVANPGGKFLEALNHLINDVTINPRKYINSTGIQDFRQLHIDQHYPNLGPVKKSSIKHHLELIASII